MNVDFADVRTVMSEMGYAMMGSGVASGEDRAEEAAEMAISSPLLEDIDLSGARGVLVNITAGFDLRLDEFETVGNTIRAFASDNATVVIGTSLDPDMNDELRVAVVATGIGMDKRPEITPGNQQAGSAAGDGSLPAAWYVAADARAEAGSQSGERQYAANRERAGLSGYPSLPA